MQKSGSRGITIAAAVCVVLIGVRVPEAMAQQQPPQMQLPPFPERPFEPPDWAPVPDDLEIVILREDVIPGQFRILDVRLNHEVEEEVLSIVANLLRDADEMPYQRTYIVYYLPGMPAGDGGWATAHFTPDLEVRFVESDTQL